MPPVILLKERTPLELASSANVFALSCGLLPEE